MHVQRRLFRRALRRFSVPIALVIATAALPLAAGSPAAAAAWGEDPPGNNGTVKVQGVDLDAPPDTDPHVGCTFLLEWYGFDKGPGIISKVTFEMQAPTGSVGLGVDGPAEVFVGGDAASGAGTATGIDGRQPYTLAFDGPAHPVQGYHVKLTVHTPGSRGADKKHKVFWVEGCAPEVEPGPRIFLEKDVADSGDADGVGTLGEPLTYSFRVTNTGDVDLADVTITDTMFGLSAAPCVDLLPVGQTTDCPQLPTQTHLVTQADVDHGSVVNLAVTSGRPPSGPDVTDADDATIPTASGDEEASVRLEKYADTVVAAPGDTVTYTLRVVNDGVGDAHDVVVTDPLPQGTTYLSSSASCTGAGSVVTCALGTIGAGDDRDVTITVKVKGIGTGDTSHTHHLDHTKIEAHLSLFDGDTGSATASCPDGYLATDGSVRLDHVDQGAGTFEDAVVLASGVTADGRGWTGTVRNDTVGQVQAKVNVVCMTERTTSGEDHSHPVVVTGPVPTTRTFAAGRHHVDLVCAAGTYAVRPSFAFSSGAGAVTTRRTGTGWRFVVDVDDAAQASFAVDCLATSLGSAAGHTHDLRFQELSDSVTVPAGQVVEKRLTCQGDHKGIVAWADLDPGFVPLGTDPQPVTRVFRFHNPTGSDLTARYGLLCVAIRTNGGNQGDPEVTNTASVSTTSPDTSRADDSASVTFVLSATGVAVAPRGAVVTKAGRTGVALRLASSARRTVSVKLLAARKVRGTDLRAGSTLAQKREKLRAGQGSVRLVARGAAGSALAKGRITRARLVITTGRHRTVRIVRLG